MLFTEVARSDKLSLAVRWTLILIVIADALK